MRHEQYHAREADLQRRFLVESFGLPEKSCCCAGVPEVNYPRLINDRYAIQPPAKAGGTAEVYKTYDVDTGRQVAIKLFSKGAIEDDILKEALEREVRALKELRHANIVELFDVEIEKTTGNQFLVLEGMDSDLWALKGASRAPIPESDGWENAWLLGRFTVPIWRNVLQADF
jgi:hypothetical protein